MVDADGIGPCIGRVYGMNSLPFNMPFINR
jgi:hypothetical protein